MHGRDVDARRIVVELEAVAELALHAESVRSRKPPCSSYDEVTTASASRRARSLRPAAAASASGVESSCSIPASPSRESRNDAGRVLAAHRAARARREAEQVGRAALDARRHVRQVAREPQQLQLEREPERVEHRDRRRPASRRAGRGTASIASNARAFGSGSTNRRSIASAPISPTARRCDCSRAAWCERRSSTPGHRVQLARALVQHQLGVRQRLEPGAEARLRLAHALRDRADPSAFAGIDMQDAIRLGKPQRPEHDGLRLVRPAHARPV